MNKIAKLDNRKLSQAVQTMSPREILKSLGRVASDCKALQVAYAPFAKVFTLNTDFNFTEQETSKTLARARKRLDHLPAIADLENLEKRLIAVLTTKADETVIAALCGFMLDAFKARTTDSTGTFIDLLMLHIEEAGSHDQFGNEKSGQRNEFEGYSPEVITAAIRIAIDAGPFAPAISEFLAYLEKARAEFWAALRRAQKLQELRQDAEFVVGYLTKEPNARDLNDEIPWDDNQGGSNDSET
jgi:hypothetical protein